ncbi:MAG: PQQ-binding-like beta-propeller repeat protein [Pirellulales bacterium]|nr:PQQ-binding-like beta-propeller repeat protein [Pirellulales bacterium]
MYAAAPISFRPSASLLPAPRRRQLAKLTRALAPAAALLFAGDRAAGQSPLVTQEQAARVGLERAWFAQAPVDAARSRVTTWYLYLDRLYAVTNSGIVTALNAETGEELWSKQVGKPGYPAYGPSANADYLGLISGSKLYLLDRHDGRAQWVRPVGSAPSSGPALSNQYAYVALVTGRIEAYKLDDPDARPWYYQSRGRTFLRPTVSGELVSWPTTEGFLYIGRADDPGVLFRLQTAGDIVTSPAYQEPNLYIASTDGYLYCINGTSGREQWRYSTGYAIRSSPAIVGQQAYVASSEPAIHAVNAQTGAWLWDAPGVGHFAAQGKQHVYGSDRFGNLVVLDAKSGVLAARMATAEGSETLVNDQSDRIFLVNDHGLVQCLREIGAVEPTFYQKLPAPPAEGAAPAEAGAAPAGAPPAPAPGAEPAEPPAEDETNPFAEPSAPDADGGNPFAEAPPRADEPAADRTDREMDTPVEEPPPDEPAPDEPAPDEPAADDNPFR